MLEEGFTYQTSRQPSHEQVPGLSPLRLGNVQLRPLHAVGVKVDPQVGARRTQNAMVHAPVGNIPPFLLLRCVCSLDMTALHG